MSGLRKFLTLGLLAVLAIPVILLAQTSSVGRVTGSLVDPKGRALKELQNYASVFAYQQGQWLEGTVYPDGRYEILNIPNGEWFVGASVNEASGFSYSKLDPSVTINGLEVKNDIMLAPIAGVISGQVIGSNGEPLPNVLVNIKNDATGEITSVESKNGSYTFFARLGKYLVSALTAPANGDILQNEVRSEVDSGKLANVALVFIKANRAITGLVAPDGANALVSGWSNSGGHTQATADLSGKYNLVVKDNDTWHIKALKESNGIIYESVESAVSLKGQDAVQDLNITLKSALPKPKTGKFSNQQPATLFLDDGMVISLPPKSVPADEFTVKVSASKGVNQKGLVLASNFYNVDIKDNQGNSITQLLRNAIIQIPYQISNFKEEVLRVFHWNTGVSAWQSNSNSAVVSKNEQIVSLTKYLAGFVAGGSEPPPPPETPPGEPPPPPPGGQTTPPTSPSTQSGSSGGGSVSPAPVSATVQLATPPSTITVTALSSTATRVAGFDPILTFNEGYNIERSLNPTSGFVQVASNLPPQLSYTDTGLTPGTTYCYRVSAVNGAGTSAPTSPACAATLTDTTAPTASNAVISFLGSSSVNLVFTTNEPTTSSLSVTSAGQVQAQAANPNFTNVHTYGLSLAAGTQYQYSASFADESGNSVLQTGTFTTLAGAPTAPAPAPAPAPAQTQPQLELPQFTRNLTIGSSGQDVRNLQIFLNSQGFTVALSGPGSSGGETTLFGALTRAALARFQAANGIAPAVGYFGPLTRGVVNRRLAP